MLTRFTLLRTVLVASLSGGLAACSTPKPLYQLERFDAGGSPYARAFPVPAGATCEAARRALLSQGYITNMSRFDAVDGTKNFQPGNDSHVVIEFHVVCASGDAGSNSSMAYVNAVQDRYSLKKTNTSASVGLSVFGSLSLPIGSSDDAMVKIASETIPAGVFYERFFNLVQHYLAGVSKAAPGTSGPETVAPPGLPSPDALKPPGLPAPTGLAPNGAATAAAVHGGPALPALPAITGNAPMAPITPGKDAPAGAGDKPGTGATPSNAHAGDAGAPGPHSSTAPPTPGPNPATTVAPTSPETGSPPAAPTSPQTGSPPAAPAAASDPAAVK